MARLTATPVGLSPTNQHQEPGLLQADPELVSPCASLKHRDHPADVIDGTPPPDRLGRLACDLGSLPQRERLATVVGTSTRGRSALIERPSEAPQERSQEPPFLDGLSRSEPVSEIAIAITFRSAAAGRAAVPPTPRPPPGFRGSAWLPGSVPRSTPGC